MEPCVGAYHLKHTLADSGGHKHTVFLTGRSHHHEHHLGGGSCAVVHRGIGRLHARELRNHALILENVLESTLRDLGLIGSIGGVELAALQKMGNHRGRIVIVCAAAGKDSEATVFGTEFLEETAQLYLRHSLGEGVFTFEYHLLRNVGIEIVDSRHADALEHGGDVAVCMGNETITHFRKAWRKRRRREEPRALPGRTLSLS